MPFHRSQSQIFEREGIDLDRSTLADWIGKSTALLERLANTIGRHVLAGSAIHADYTPLKLLAPGNGKTKTARVWVYARDERPWSGDAPPAAWYRFSVDREAAHPADHLDRFRDFLHAVGYAGFNDLYRKDAIREVACMAHIRRRFVNLHQSQGRPSLQRQSPVSPPSTLSRSELGAVRPMNGAACAKLKPYRRWAILKPGSAPSSVASPERQPWPPPSDTL